MYGPGVGERMNYAGELARAMHMLGERPNAIFMGQGVGCPGTTMSPTFAGVPATKLLEMPVAEDLQMGMAIGMALEGLLPVCVFPRWNFLICAANQLVNHLDRLPLYSDGGYTRRSSFARRCRAAAHSIQGRSMMMISPHRSRRCCAPCASSC